MNMKKTLIGLMMLFAQAGWTAQVAYVESYEFKDSAVVWENSPTFVVCTECPFPSNLRVSDLSRLLAHVKFIPSVRVQSQPSASNFESRLEDSEELKAYFCFNSSELLKPEREKIAQFVKPRLKDWAFEVFGYACPIGSEAYNLELSQRRAQAAASFIKELGGEVVLVQGKGEVVFDPHRYEESRCVVIKTKKKGGTHGEAE